MIDAMIADLAQGSAAIAAVARIYEEAANVEMGSVGG